MSELRVESWTNKLGQVINPGDPVVAVSKSTGTIGISVGKFVGVRYGEVRHFVTDLDENGVQKMEERWGRQYPKQKVEVTVAPIAVSVEGIPRKVFKNVAPEGQPRKYEYVDTVTKSTFPRMRVFKIDAPLTDLAGINL